MLELGSPIGGEGNGGVVYPAVHPTRDAAAAAALVLSLLAVREASLEAVVAALPRYAIVKEALPLSQGFDPLGDGRLEELFPGAVPDRRDGARFEWEGERAWLHVRRSGTEPLARIIAEAPTLQRARELVARARAALAPGLAAAASAPA
jgi:phosphomannomutase